MVAFFLCPLSRLQTSALLLSIAYVVGNGSPALANEGGDSFWLLGTSAMEAGITSAPGLSIRITYYSSGASSKGWTSKSDGRIEEGSYISSTYLMLTPSYAFERPVLGGQLEFGVTMLAGNYSSTSSTKLFPPSGPAEFDATSDSMTAFGDLFPQVSLKWNRNVHNFMIYAAASVPSGAYDMNRRASVGSGTWALDGGVGYTYYDKNTGHEFSAILGSAYNFMNPYTAYQSGIDLHLELSASQYVTDSLSLGLAGYFLTQITGDSGPDAFLGPFMSRVVGIGPHLAYDFKFGDRAASLSAGSYYEFAGENRAQGWNAWLTLSIALGPFDNKLAKGRNEIKGP